MGNNIYEGTFLSAGGTGYRAPSPRKPEIKEIIQHMQRCWDEITRNAIRLQQAALEQERTEQCFERLAKAVTIVIELIKEPVVGAAVTEEWTTNRDQAIMVLREMLDGARQQDEITGVDLTPFQKQFQEAMHALIGSPEYLPILRYFRAAYEYRKYFPWLAESTETPTIIQQTGLSYALQTALVKYIVLDDSEALRSEIQSATGEDLAESLVIDPVWGEELTAATAATVREHFNLQRFEKHLARVRISSDVEILKQHIAAAFISYYKRCEIGIVPDPWDLML